jgi:hypothetical protein
MMTDKEMLELAAKAAGYSCRIRTTKIGIEKFYVNGHVWNPLTDDGDALRLAINLDIDVAKVQIKFWDKHSINPYAATRRAIVRAAAEIGKEKK